MIEQVISHYQIIKKLGAGGMGEVYLAEDMTLNRRIALKLLPAEFTGDKEHLRRFKREAKASSALNHPNILTIHEVGEEGGRHFIATEHIEGETLRQHIRQIGKMKASAVLDVGAQIASALAASHEAGIVHRDIKPDNIMIRHDGFVKVLDFGLAKLTGPLFDPRSAGFQDRETVKDLTRTEPGVIMGTASYMSPEQAQGLPVDTRSDIWSLGVVIFEMASGRAPFEGATLSQVIAAILEKEPPPLSHFLPGVPAELQRIVSKALRKDREERYQTIHDMRVDLRSLKQELEFESKKLKKKEEKSFLDTFLAFWTTLPGILTGIAALITLIAVLYITGRDTDSKSVAHMPTPQPTSILPPSPGPSPAPTSEDCFIQYFSGIPKARVAIMELGTREFRLIRLDQPKDRVIGVRFTDYNRTIGAIRFYFFPANKIFKVETLVDSKCQEIEEYSNANRGGDKRVLQNYDALQMRLGDDEYSFYVAYGEGEIFASFTRVSP